MVTLHLWGAEARYSAWPSVAMPSISTAQAITIVQHHGRVTGRHSKEAETKHAVQVHVEFQYQRAVFRVGGGEAQQEGCTFTACQYAPATYYYLLLLLHISN